MSSEIEQDNEQRIVPTRAGWWWAEVDGGAIEAMEVCDFGAGLRYVTALDAGPVDISDITWLAPIPGPATCVALAGYVAAVAAYDADELRGASHELTDAEWSESESIERAVSDATANLDAAIRAERDGGA